MPELPEVETVMRGLSPVMAGRRIVSAVQRRADLRFPFPERFAERLTGRRVEALARRAKYILAPLDDGMVLVMHMGMSGRFVVGDLSVGEAARVYAAPAVDPQHTHVELAFEDRQTVSYNDPRRFGLMDLVPAAGLETHKLFRHLGMEPLGPDFDGRALEHLLAGRRTPLKAALLDQRLIVGIGNIYACEAMHRAGLSPQRLAGTVAGRRAAGLATAIRAVLEEAIAAGGSTLRDYAAVNGELGYFQHRFEVYDREGEACRRQRCAGVVARLVQGGRSTFYCQRCQR